MPTYKRLGRNLYAVHHPNTGFPVHVQRGLFNDSKEHFRMVNTGSVTGYDCIDPERVGPRVTNMYTDGNHLVIKQPVENSLWQECGVQWYNHPTYGMVYLVYNLSRQKPIPLPPHTPTTAHR